MSFLIFTLLLKFKNIIKFGRFIITQHINNKNIF